MPENPLRETCLIQVRPYDSRNAEDRALWEAFVDRSNNGTVFHRQAFLDYHPKDRFAFHSLFFFREGEVVALLPGALLGGEYRSPAGASFGGLITAPGLTLAEADGVVAALIAYCRALGLEAIRLTPPMAIYQGTPDDTVEFALYYHGFQSVNPLYSSVIDLRRIRGKEDLSKNTRHKINKALNKGVEVRQSRDFEAFYPILLENKAKHEARPAHTLEELQDLDRRLPSLMTLFLAYVEGVPVAGELLFSCNPHCVLNFYTMHRYEYRNHFPVNLLIEEGIRWSISRGFRYYDYGVSADTKSENPLEPSWPLIVYKESMGGLGCIRRSFALRL